MHRRTTKRNRSRRTVLISRKQALSWASGARNLNSATPISAMRKPASNSMLTAIPSCSTRIGMFAEWFEFRLGWNYVQERTALGGISDTVDGAEDLYLGCKLAVCEQDGLWPELAITPQMTVPTVRGRLRPTK